MSITTCVLCKREFEYDKQEPIILWGREWFHELQPNVCDNCDKRGRVSVAGAEWLQKLPYKEWDERIGKREALNTIGAACFSNKKLRQGVVYVVGGVASGKSTSVCELCRIAQARGVGGRYISCPDMLSEYSRSLGEGDSGYAEALAATRGVLVIDDLGVGKLTERGVELLYYVFNKRMEDKHSTTWVTSNWDVDGIGNWIMKSGSEEVVAQRIARRIAERAVVVRI